MKAVTVPFFRPELTEDEFQAVLETLPGGLTTGPRVRRFEQEFASAVCASHAVAVNSSIATLHSVLEAAPFSREARLLGVGIPGGCIAALVWATLPSTSSRRVDLILRLSLAFAILHVSDGAVFLAGLVHLGGRWGEAPSPAAARSVPE